MNTETNKPRTQSFFNEKGQSIGSLRDGIFRKRVKTKNLMQIYNAYGIEKTVVEELEALGCQEIRLLDEEKTLYTVPFSIFRRYAFEKNHETPQYFLGRHYYTQPRSDQLKLKVHWMEGGDTCINGYGMLRKPESNSARLLVWIGVTQSARG